jgi:hypothetical protein
LPPPVTASSQAWIDSVLLDPAVLLHGDKNRLPRGIFGQPEIGLALEREIRQEAACFGNPFVLGKLREGGARFRPDPGFERLIAEELRDIGISPRVL